MAGQDKNYYYQEGLSPEANATLAIQYAIDEAPKNGGTGVVNIVDDSGKVSQTSLHNTPENLAQTLKDQGKQ
ncbi:hypothetical protein GCM10023088_55360 [Actinomadura verrucosospora]|uniref:hypothetical protein n=1 Tax=Actinomadura verrucosospora TaxID=46165 RepID=UPI0031ED954C